MATLIFQPSQDALTIGVQEVPGSNPGGPTKTLQRLTDATNSRHPILASNLESKAGRPRQVRRQSELTAVVSRRLSSEMQKVAEKRAERLILEAPGADSNNSDTCTQEVAVVDQPAEPQAALPPSPMS